MECPNCGENIEIEDRRGGGLIQGILLLLVLYFLIVKMNIHIPFISNLFKYKRKTAKEWFEYYNATLVDYETCRSELDDIKTVVDEELLKLGKCVKENENFYSDIIQECQKSGKFTPKECSTIVIESAKGFVEGKKECVAKYLEQ